jgi:hypothetical protein
MTPNYQWKWKDLCIWTDVSVDYTTGQVTEDDTGYVYPTSWSSFEDNPEIDTRPYKYDSGDKVNHPSHYGQGKIECIEYIEDFLTKEEFIGYLRGNIAKYLHRWRYKNGLEDLKKAQWYQDKLIEVVSDDDL